MGSIVISICLHGVRYYHQDQQLLAHFPNAGRPFRSVRGNRTPERQILRVPADLPDPPAAKINIARRSIDDHCAADDCVGRWRMTGRRRGLLLLLDQSGRACRAGDRVGSV